MSKKRGLGVNALLPDEPKRPGRRGVDEARSRATFNLPQRIKNELERVWIEARTLAGDEGRTMVNKSAIVEAALTEIIADFDKKGNESILMSYFPLSDE